MAVDFKLEQSGIQLTITFSDVVGHATIKEYAPQGIRCILVCRQDAPFELEIAEELAFGKRVGDLVANTGIVMAVVLGPTYKHDVFIDTSIFNKGVTLAQFESEEEARDWLARKCPPKLKRQSKR